MSLPPLPEGHERILGDVGLSAVPSGAYIPGDGAFAALDALADRFNLAAFATRGSPEPTPREVLTHGASTSSSILNLSPEAAAKSSKMRSALARLVSDAALASGIDQPGSGGRPPLVKAAAAGHAAVVTALLDAGAPRAILSIIAQFSDALL